MYMILVPVAFVVVVLLVLLQKRYAAERTISGTTIPETINSEPALKSVVCKNSDDNTSIQGYYWQQPWGK
jgi:hypothetical protein